MLPWELLEKIDTMIFVHVSFGASLGLGCFKPVLIGKVGSLHHLALISNWAAYAALY